MSKEFSWLSRIAERVSLRWLLRIHQHKAKNSPKEFVVGEISQCPKGPAITNSVRTLGLGMLCLFVCAVANVAHADSVQYTYDAAGRLSGVIDPVNGSATYQYDAVGNLLSVTRNPITSLVIAQVTPSNAAPSAIITIFGTGFGTTGNTTVSFNGANAVPSAVTATSITVPVPVGATSGPIKVTSPVGTATTSSNFSVIPLSAPVISGFSPTTALPGATITITGSGFNSVISNNRVFVNGALVSLSSASPTTLVGTLPVVTSGHVSVETPGGSMTTISMLVVPPLAYSTNTIGSVTQSALGSSATSTASASGQVGLILFDAAAGQRISMQTVSSSISGLLSLFGPNGVQIGPSSNLTAGGFFDTEPLGTGTYTVVVGPASGSGSAAISLISVPPDVSAAILANGTSITLTTTAVGQNMALTFSGSAGQQIDLENQVSTTSGQLSGCSPITITEPDQLTQLYYNSCFNYNSVYSGPLVLPMTGTYQVFYNPAGTDVGSATFTLYTDPPNATAAITANGTAVTLTTTTPGQTMGLTFSGTAGQRINLENQVASTSGQFSGCTPVTILEPGGLTSIYSNSCFNYPSVFSDVVTLPVSGTYQVIYTPPAGDVGSATFTLFAVPGDATSTISANGSPATLTTTTPGQNMNLTFSGTAGQRINLENQVTSSSGQSQGCSPVTILEPDGITQLYSNSCFNYNAITSGLVVLPVSGSYTIFYNPPGGDIGSATFTLYTVPPNASAAISANGNTTTLSTTAPSQGFQLTFSGTAGNAISLLTQEAAALYQQPGCFSVTITEPNGTTQLYSRSSQCAQSDFSDALILPVTGTYTITMFPPGMAFGTASFTLYTVPNSASGTLVAGGGSVGATVTTPGQNVKLNFAATVGNRVSLLAQEDSSLSQQCATLTITDPDGVTQLYNNLYCSSSNFTGVLPPASAVSTTIPTLTQSGTYTVLLNPSSTATGTATLTLYSVPPDVTGSVVINQSPVSLTTTAPGQSARATFTGAANQGVTVKMAASNEQPGSTCITITTLQPNGQTILRQDLTCGTSYASSSLTLPLAGTYTIVTTPSSAVTGTFAISVTSP